MLHYHSRLIQAQLHHRDLLYSPMSTYNSTIELVMYPLESSLQEETSSQPLSFPIPPYYTTSHPSPAILSSYSQYYPPICSIAQSLLSVVRSGTSSTLGVSSHVEFGLADSVEAHASVSERIVYPWQEQFDDLWSQNSSLGETDCSCPQQHRVFSYFSTILYRRWWHVVLEEREDELRRWKVEISSGMGSLEDASGFEVDVDEEDFISRRLSGNSRWNPNPGLKFGLSVTGSSNFKLRFSNPSTNECFECLYLKVVLERRR